MHDRVKAHQDQVMQTFIADVGNALSGMTGDVDAVCDKFAEEHDRHTAQAVLQLMHRIQQLRAEASHEMRRKMRQESGFPG